MGMFMGSRQSPGSSEGRAPLIMLTDEAGQPSGVWWTEKDDLVLGLTGAADADAIIAALDGKTPSAAEHAVLSEIVKPEGSFMPLMTAFIDPSAVPSQAPTQDGSVLREAQGGRAEAHGLPLGLRRRRAAEHHPTGRSGARKSLFAMFDQPKLDTKQLIPVPEGVDSFVVMSISPAKVLDARGPGRATAERPRPRSTSSSPG